MRIYTPKGIPLYIKPSQAFQAQDKVFSRTLSLSLPPSLSSLKCVCGCVLT